MGKFRAYIDEVQSIRFEFFPAAESRIQRLGAWTVAAIAALPESNSWKSFPQVDSPEVCWNSPDLDPAVLEQELQEILDESKPVS